MTRPLVPTRIGIAVSSTILNSCSRQPCDRRRPGPIWDIATMTAKGNVTVAGVVRTVTISAELHPAINPAYVSTSQTINARGFRVLIPAGQPPANIPPGEPWVTLTYTSKATLGFDITNATTNRNFTYTTPMPPYEWQTRGTPLDATTFEVLGGTGGASARPTRLPAGTHEIKVFPATGAFHGDSLFFGQWDLTE